MKWYFYLFLFLSSKSKINIQSTTTTTKKQAYLKQQEKYSDKQPNLSSKEIRERKTIKNQIQQEEGNN